MRKTGMIPAALIPACFFMIPAACADYGYTTVDSIPMAADFTITVELDEAGLPHIVTDYPFEQTGATELHVSYSIGGQPAFDLKYNPATKSTTMPSYYRDVLGGNPEETAFQALRNGDATMDDTVTIGTSHFGSQTDWFLSYSLSGRSYVQYEEVTEAQSFNAMGPGGVAKTVYYSGGQLWSSRVVKRTETADLVITYGRNGEIETGDVTVYTPQLAWYRLDTSTGLFNGHTLQELGFEEGDLELPALAAVGEEVTTVVGVPKEVPAPAADRSTFALTGGLLSGIMIGLVLYVLFRRKKKTPAAPAGTEEKTDSGAAQAPEETFDSAPKAFSSGK